ncbi:MAG: YicC family protein [Desulfobulbaceae bacterium]|jgi:uncharacterized protein (TIGR00255 family)|nr:YicC family protein [Candidatus Kapabacteria bacterium]MBS4001473.1 YicC family protein [Desulfobulbaceae bacterium]
MFKSMTGFSKSELSENGINIVIELRSLNGKFLELGCRLPRAIQHRENEIREIVKRNMTRGSVNINVNLELDANQSQFIINDSAATHVYDQLQALKKNFKFKETIKLDNLLAFSSYFVGREESADEEEIMKVVTKVLREALKKLDIMRTKEGKQILNDITNRLKKITENVNKIEKLGIEKIPAERERLKQRIAQMFESDEYDEQRLQTEMVLLADKLDISEECVRLYSHFKFFNETIKSNEPSGRKLNFLLQEMNREINTIGSKASDSYISQLVVLTKEELERIREQIQNIE